MMTKRRKTNTLTSVNKRVGTDNRYKQFAISLYVSNKPGVLIRIALVFARRGYNIDSLAVSSANDPAFSWMHIVASGDEGSLDQILRQLEKLVDVIRAEPHVYDNALELAGSPGKIDTLHAMVAKFRILEFLRTGKIMLPRGDEQTS